MQFPVIDSRIWRGLVACVATSLFAVAACTVPMPGPEPDSDPSDPEWAGLYRGVLPCADCEGVDTVLELHADGSWERTQRYLGESDELFVSSGRIAPSTAVDAENEASGTGSLELVVLEAETPDEVAYRADPDSLLQLDRDRRVITGDLEDRYRLRLVGRGADDPRRLEGEWWVEELRGAAVEADRTRRRRAHLAFDFIQPRLSFTGGCNQFAGTVRYDGPGRISMPALFAGTKMLCPGRADLDQELTEALGVVSRWRIVPGPEGEGPVLELFRNPEEPAMIRLVRPQSGSDAAAETTTDREEAVP